MKAGSGALLVIVGLMVMWLAITGRLGNVIDAIKGATRDDASTGGAGTKGVAGSVPIPGGESVLTALQPLPTLPTVGAWRRN